MYNTAQIHRYNSGFEKKRKLTGMDFHITESSMLAMNTYHNIVNCWLIKTENKEKNVKSTTILKMNFNVKLRYHSYFD